MEEDRLIPISALQHFSFCPRQCGLIHIEQCFEDNALTIRGHAVHNRITSEDGHTLAETRIEYSLPLYSNELGIAGEADVVEFWEDGTVYPVEYKHGKRAAKIHDEIQLAAQAMCLEEMTSSLVAKGAIYHHSSRRRREVLIDERLRTAVRETIAQVRKMLESMKLPAPVFDNKCKNCSLIDLCQPSIMTNEHQWRTWSRRLFSAETE
jgi:CRISPR-associated exonuclease Cas4